jgi:hypothetical protein
MAQQMCSVIQPPRKRLEANSGAAAEGDCRIVRQLSFAASGGPVGPVGQSVSTWPK